MISLAPPRVELIVGPNAPIMGFDDRARDRQAETHARFLGRKETIEQSWQMLCINARAAIFDNAAHRLLIDFLRSNGNISLHEFQLRSSLVLH